MSKIANMLVLGDRRYSRTEGASCANSFCFSYYMEKEGVQSNIWKFIEVPLKR